MDELRRNIVEEETGAIYEKKTFSSAPPIRQQIIGANLLYFTMYAIVLMAISFIVEFFVPLFVFMIISFLHILYAVFLAIFNMFRGKGKKEMRYAFLAIILFTSSLSISVWRLIFN